MRLARDRAGGCTPGEPLSCLRQGRGVAPRASRLLAYGKGGGLHPGRAAFLPAARAGVAPRASRFLAYGKSGKLHTAARRKHAGVYGRPTLSTRLAAGGSCPFLELVAGEASPAPPGRGLCPLPTLLRGALPPRPPNGGRCPPYPPLKSLGPLPRGKGKYGLQEGNAPVCTPGGGGSCPFLELVAGEASPAPPGRGLRPLPTPLRGALPPGPPKGGRGRTGQAAFLPAARAGGCTPGEPPSCVPQGRKALYCS